MRISDLKVYALSAPETCCGSAALVKVTTDAGISGWGEAVTNCYLTDEALYAIKTITEHGLKGLLIGEDPLETRKIWEKVYASSEISRGTTIHALSAIDIALMDIAGKALKVPVHTLLGGCFHESVRLYASMMLNPQNPDETVREASKLVEEGFTAIKFGHTLWLPISKPLEMIRRLRDSIGYDVEFMVDGPGCLNLIQAMKWARALEKYEISWCEEPMKRDDLEGYAKLSRAVDIAIAGGEHRTTRHEFKEIITKRAMDIIQPDVGDVGGITEFKNVADMAQMWGVMCIPHSWSTALNTVASLHLVASMRDGFLLEYRTTPTPLMTELLSMDSAKIEKGYMRVPKEPGLGIDMHQDAIEKYLVDSSL